MIPFPIPEAPKCPGSHLKTAARPSDTADSSGGPFTLGEEAAPKTGDVPRDVNSVEEPEGGADHLADKTSQGETEDAQMALASGSDAPELPDRVSDTALTDLQGEFGPTRSALTVAPNQPTKLDDPKKPEEGVVSHVGSATSRLNEKGYGEQGSLAYRKAGSNETKIADVASESTSRYRQLSNEPTVQQQIRAQNAGLVKDGTPPIFLRNDAPFVAPHDMSGRVQRSAETGGTLAAAVASKPDGFVSGIGSVQSADSASTGPTFTASETEKTKAGHIETEGTRHENAVGSGFLRPEGRSEMVPLRSPNTAPSFHLPAATHRSLAGNQPETAQVSGQNSPETQPAKVSPGAVPTDVPATDYTLTGLTRTGTDRHARDQAAPVFSPVASTLAATPGAKTRASSAAEIKLSAKGAPPPAEASGISSRFQQIANANTPQHELATKILDAPSNIEASGSVPRPTPQLNTAPIPNAVQSDVSQPEIVGAPEKPTRREPAPIPPDAIPNPSPAPKRMDHARAIYLTTAELGAAKTNMDDPKLTATRAHVGETAETLAAGSPPLVAASGGSGHASAAMPPAPASIAQSIAHQIGISLPRMPDRPVEIALSPEELGHVRMTLHASQSGMTVAIQADRAETLDLMRRHIDTLAREMHDMGYGSLDFQFSQRDERPQQRPDMLDGLGAGPGVDPIETPIAPTPRATARLAPPQSGLDLRM